MIIMIIVIIMFSIIIIIIIMCYYDCYYHYIWRPQPGRGRVAPVAGVSRIKLVIY